MGQAVPIPDRPTYQQLEEILRRKDNLFKTSWSAMEEMRAILWMTSMAHEGNQNHYNTEEYAITACIVSRFIDRHIRSLDDEIEHLHRNVSTDVLAGLPEKETSMGREEAIND